MLIFYFFIIPGIYSLIKFFLFLYVSKNGKFSYDGFNAAGFSYNSQDDSFFSNKEAWQKKFGYCHLYDVTAPLFRMIIDTEPIKFYYNNKNYLITFWKGQYGMCTGAEIGIYNTKQKFIDKKTLYFPVKDEEMLDMNFTLYKKGDKIASTSGKHWWLTIFKLGMFSWPKDLTMDIQITFTNHEMLQSFIKAFKKLKYKEEDFKIVDNTFYFTFKKPHSRKVWTRGLIVDSIRQYWNKKNTKLYDKYLVDLIDDNNIDDSSSNKKIILLKDYIPSILKGGNDIIQSKRNKNNTSLYLSDNIFPNKNSNG